MNGGQTTNSIFGATYANKMDLGLKVEVPVKLCVLNNEQMDVLGPKISRFANTQNQVKRSDLASNHKVYKEIEQLSRTRPAPPKEGSQIETKWFFERAKGQYTDELSLKTVSEN